MECCGDGFLEFCNGRRVKVCALMFAVCFVCAFFLNEECRGLGKKTGFLYVQAEVADDVLKKNIFVLQICYLKNWDCTALYICFFRSQTA